MYRKMRPTFDQIYMNLAHLMAERSMCSRLKVGCVITDGEGTRVLAIGYNGNYRGGKNGCDTKIPGKCGCLHAEDNAVIKLDYKEPTKIAYVTHRPCKMCAKRLINAGVSRIIYDKEYRLKDSIELLSRTNIQLERYEE